jgi:hypothetical protein
MPISMIPAALGLCFLLVWVFIGGMIFRDSQLAAESERDADIRVLPLLPGPTTYQKRLKPSHPSRGGTTTVRVAS